MRHTFPALGGLLLSSLVLAGCGGESGDYKAPKTGGEVHVDAEPTAPHGGHIVHLEPHHAVHLEMTFDSAKREAKLYVIEEKDGKFEAHPIADESLFLHHTPEGADAEIEVEFTAVRADGATTASEFVAAGDALPEGITDEHDLVGHVHLNIDDKEYEGELSHDGHAHHDH